MVLEESRVVDMEPTVGVVAWAGGDGPKQYGGDIGSGESLEQRSLAACFPSAKAGKAAFSVAAASSELAFSRSSFAHGNGQSAREEAINRLGPRGCGLLRVRERHREETATCMPGVEAEGDETRLPGSNIRRRPGRIAAACEGFSRVAIDWRDDKEARQPKACGPWEPVERMGDERVPLKAASQRGSELMFAKGELRVKQPANQDGRGKCGLSVHPITGPSVLHETFRR
ncbi:hypothetical protein CCHR01_18688 [Colletotrichum chrysophilum]|uniref:Uncharacterized protein n=1 Tax=Colletotrichum chrysophilum TaxID=1836956 RepID=A0AAD8ZZM5_9PEZI|nr:hypothetical protein CCHR01_18688 [Colletotrichum chrysophilum]